MATTLGYLRLPVLPRTGGPALAANYRIQTALNCSSRFQTPTILKASVFRHERGLQSTCRSSAAPVTTAAVSNEFVEQEAAKFRDDLLKSQGEDENSAKIADICTEVMKGYFASYNGIFLNEPFAKMKEALDGAGLPANKVLLAAIGWTRANLYTDWKNFSSK